MATLLVKLLDEGTLVYRPVLASRMGKDTFKINEFQNYDRENEHWEFEPGDEVLVEERMFDGENRYVAICKTRKTDCP
jgi:hypothetical protein